jgi:hypothetical protein
VTQREILAQAASQGQDTWARQSNQQRQRFERAIALQQQACCCYFVFSRKKEKPRL